ncbi:MFS transporter [Candidatus Bathyarchaeota archaeon]|nr:MFS transporter [Candidatus Bathyarchaeota archaeon]
MHRIKSVLDFIKGQKKPFKVNMVRVSFSTFLSSLTQQYQSVYIVEKGATPFELGFLNSLGGLAGASISPVSGWFADRYGIKKGLLLGTILMALASLVFAEAPTWIYMIPAMLLLMLANRVLMTVCPMVCGSYLKNEERATGMQLCDTLSAVPGIFSPLVAAMIITRFGGLRPEGIQPLYYIQFIGFALVSLFVAKEYSDLPEIRRVDSSIKFLSGIKEVLEEGVAVKQWILYMSMSTLSFFVSSTYLPLFVKEVKQGDQYVLGAMATASMLVPLVLAIPTGRLADSIGRKKVIYVTTAIYCLSMVLVIYAPNPVFLVLSGLLQGFWMLAGVTQGAMSAELVPTHLLGRWYGLLGVFRGVISVVAPLIGGVIWSAISPTHVLTFIIFSQVLKILVLWIMVPETLKGS